MTAHVVPRAKPILSAGEEGDEEEKTTIESPWEDEASTTVEQGEVADKIRALGGDPARRQNTGVTNTSASQLDEPTVDDQHVPALAPVTQVRAEAARLLITAGNDSGRQIEIRPGKTYTIGRAIDNDVVLTDIAVSRKHFDLRHEDGAWIIVDRGSGNGTVVNGNVEDNPFMLANGDTIEIGNTIFRYEQANGPARTRAPSNLGAFEGEDEEMSTVAGKPMRPDIVDVEEMPPPRAMQPRPKTLPPPTPLRSVRAPTQPPPVPSMMPSQTLAALQPSSTMPLAQMANRPPTAPAAPTMLGDPMLGGPMANGMNNPLANGSNGMVPMNGMNPLAHGSMPGQPARPMYGQYPQATEIPPHSVHAQMLLIQTQNRRGDGSTAHVPPTPFDGVQLQPRYSQPQLSKRTKLILGGAGLALFAAIATIAIVKSGGSEKPTAVPATAGAEQPKLEPSVTAIETPKTAAPTVAQPTTNVKATAPTTTQPTTKAATPTVTQPTTKATAPTTTQPATQPAIAKTEPKVEPKVEPKAVAKTEPKVEPKAVAKTEPKVVARTEPKVEKKREPTRTVTRTAAATDSSSARTKADSLYHAKKFNDASSVLAAAARSAEDDEAKDLRRTADMYAKLGRSYSSGMAPAAKAVDAYEQLQSAINYDGNVGGAFTDELQTKLAQVAPKAAIGFMAAKNYPRARNAVITAEKLGSTAEALKMVRQKLESVAADLYSEAQKETDATTAKEKYRTIMSIVDSKSIWYGRAAKAIAKL